MGAITHSASIPKDEAEEMKCKGFISPHRTVIQIMNILLKETLCSRKAWIYKSYAVSKKSRSQALIQKVVVSRGRTQLDGRHSAVCMLSIELSMLFLHLIRIKRRVSLSTSKFIHAHADYSFFPKTKLRMPILILVKTLQKLLLLSNVRQKDTWIVFSLRVPIVEKKKLAQTLIRSI